MASKKKKLAKCSGTAYNTLNRYLKTAHVRLKLPERQLFQKERFPNDTGTVCCFACAFSGENLL
ncbi:MAG: hypothetical protein IJ191_03155 [Treponema sp.]|nr:hypothetical protein [Treponema sp.]